MDFKNMFKETLKKALNDTSAFIETVTDTIKTNTTTYSSAEVKAEEISEPTPPPLPNPIEYDKSECECGKCIIFDVGYYEENSSSRGSLYYCREIKFSRELFHTCKKPYSCPKNRYSYPEIQKNTNLNEKQFNLIEQHFIKEIHETIEASTDVGKMAEILKHISNLKEDKHFEFWNKYFKEICMWIEGSNETRKHILNTLLEDLPNQGLKNIKDVLWDIFEVYGIDPSFNHFLEFLLELQFEPKASQKDNFKELYKRYLRDEPLNLKHKYLQNESLYNRNLNDFNYTVGAFEMILDPSTLSKFYKDTTYISIEQFYDGNQILPAGLDCDQEEPNIYTIKGVLLKWETNEDGTSNVKNASIEEYDEEYNEEY